MRNLFALIVTIGLLAVPGTALSQTTGQYGAVQVVNSGPASNPDVIDVAAYD